MINSCIVLTCNSYCILQINLFLYIHLFSFLYFSDHKLYFPFLRSNIRYKQCLKSIAEIRVKRTMPHEPTELKLNPACRLLTNCTSLRIIHHFKTQLMTWIGARACEFSIFSWFHTKQNIYVSLYSQKLITAELIETNRRWRGWLSAGANRVKIKKFPSNYYINCFPTPPRDWRHSTQQTFGQVFQGKKIGKTWQDFPVIKLPLASRLFDKKQRHYFGGTNLLRVFQ